MPTNDRPRLAVQLYSLRDSIGELATLIPKLAADGYVGVEPFGAEFGAVDADTLAKLLADNGMTAPACHTGLGKDGRFDEAMLDQFQTIGVETAIVPALHPDEFKDSDGVSRAAERLAAAAEQVAPRGMTVGYHNHFWEFATIDGRPALTELFARAGEGIVAEIDTYWAQVGGVDAAEFVAGLGDRVRFLHVKDGPADTREAANVAVGAGAMDIPAILTANPAVQWHVVEFDRCDTDVYAGIAASARYLADLGLTEVRS